MGKNYNFSINDLNGNVLNIKSEKLKHFRRFGLCPHHPLSIIYALLLFGKEIGIFVSLFILGSGFILHTRPHWTIEYYIQLRHSFKMIRYRVEVNGHDEK